MKSIFQKGESGFILFEIIIIAAILALLAATVAPDMTDFITQGGQRFYRTDKQKLTKAVEAWREERTNSWPTLDGSIGMPYEGATPGFGNDVSGETNSYIDLAMLAAGGYLSGADTIRSADTDKNTSASNPDGSYGWYIDSAGEVQSNPSFTHGVYP